MEGVRAKWSDDRLDALSGRVDERFDDLSGRVTRLEARMDTGFNEVNSTLHSIQRSMIVTLASVLAASGGLIVAIRF